MLRRVVVSTFDEQEPEHLADNQVRSARVASTTSPPMHLRDRSSTVYFDEAGNTGAFLLDSAQPVFTLASVDFTDKESSELLSIVKTSQTKEAKFTSLRKSNAGEARVLKFFQSPLLTPQRAKVTITHKRFMVVSKMVDLIIETMAHEVGFDLYKNGTNLALSNLHFHIMPSFCGEDLFKEALEAFVAMIRESTPASNARFFDAIRALRKATRNRRFKSDLDLFLAAEPAITDILDGIDYTALDPAIPAFFFLCSNWGQQLREPFNVVHDASKPIAASKDTLEAMMSEAVEPALIGYDRRKVEFPLRATGIAFDDSKDRPGLQVADLLAGAVAYFAVRVATGTRDEFSKRLEAVGIEQFSVMNVWPELKVTPHELETAAHSSDTDVVEMMTEYLRRRDVTRR